MGVRSLFSIGSLALALIIGSFAHADFSAPEKVLEKAATFDEFIGNSQLLDEYFEAIKTNLHYGDPITRPSFDLIIEQMRE